MSTQNEKNLLLSTKTYPGGPVKPTAKESSAVVQHDWKEIAMQLAKRLNFAITYGKFGSGFMLDTTTNKSIGVKDYLADGLEMIPGVSVNRELMHMTPAERRKATKKGSSHG